MKRAVCRGAVCLIALAVLPESTSHAQEVAVRINKDTVTVAEFYKRVENVSVADLAPAAQGRGPAKAGEYAMERIILESLLTQIAAAKNVAPTDAEISRYVELAKKYAQSQVMSLMAPNPFRTDEDYKHEAKIALIQRGLALAPLKITPQDISKKYEEVKARLTEEDKYHLRVIQVSSPEKAQKTLAMLKKGAAFEALVLTQSEDPDSKSKRGDIGVVPQYAMPPDFLAAIKNLKPGDFTKTAVKLGGTSEGGQPAIPVQYLIAQVVEKLPGKTPTLDEAKYIVERILLNDKDPNWGERIQGEISNARKAADIQVNLEQYKKLVEQIKSGAAPSTPAIGK